MVRRESKILLQRSRCVLTSALLVFGLMGSVQAAPATAVTGTAITDPSSVTAAVTETVAEGTAEPAVISTDPVVPVEPPARVPPADLSIWGMYQNADIVVKVVMLGLILASIATWAILLAKGGEIIGAKRRLRRELQVLLTARTLDDTPELTQHFRDDSVSRQLLHEAQLERKLSIHSCDNQGIKERVVFRLDRRVAAISRQIGQGNGILATIGAISPFVGLFGTVWGIMNSFIGIAKTQTTNLAVVAPGIAEALLATGIGLVAAIPAVVIYNLFVRQIMGYRAQVGDAAAQILLLLSRDLDVASSASQAGSRRTAPPLHIQAAG